MGSIAGSTHAGIAHDKLGATTVAASPPPAAQTPAVDNGLARTVALSGAGAAAVGVSLLMARSFVGSQVAAARLSTGGMALAAVGIAGLLGAALMWKAHDAPAAVPPRPVPTPAPGPAPAPTTPTPTAPTRPAPTTPAAVQTVTGSREPGAARPGGPGFSLTEVASGLDNPVHVTHAPGDDEGLYVVEQNGIIKRVAGATTTTFLDVSSRTDGGGEQGLLSVAFHPDYESNGKLYLNYTDRAGDTHVSQMTARDGRVDPASHVDLMVMDQPYGNHNGGQLQFGPDGYLYVGMGDGGSGGDPQNRSQNPNEHMGKMLRLDVDHPEGGKPYGIPDDNMFAAAGGGKPEIWAMGLRNPWRFSFDAQTGDMWIGDVGQGAWEEVDFVPRGTAPGTNFGWKAREGANPYSTTPQGPGRLLDPVLQYSHSEGASITGGYVYRGEKIPSLQGWYVYADIAADEVRALRQQDGRVVERRVFEGAPSMIVSFGEGPDGELYLTSLDGKLMRFDPQGPQGPGPVDPIPPQPGAPTMVELGTIPGRMRFDKDVVRAPAGTITLRFTNNDSTFHNVAIDGPRNNRKIGPMVNRNGVSEVTIELEPGTYEFYCSPHQFMGMKGTLIVE